MFIDSHVHLDLPQFDQDREQVLERAQATGVDIVLAVAMAAPDRDSLARTLDCAESHKMVYASIGVHPHHARSASPAFLRELTRHSNHPKVVFWGETGLDYHYRNSPFDSQREAFVNQIRISRDCDLPLVIHCRDAWSDLLRILDEEASGMNYRGILHSFTGDTRMAQRLVELGFHISFSGIVGFHHSERLREAARGLRLDQVLIETDAPYVVPSPHRGHRNEPAYLPDVAISLSEAMDVSVDDIARNTSRNFRRLAGLPGNHAGDVLVYAIRDRLYINLTNRCTARCVFCRRESSPVASGYDLSLEREHSVAEYMNAVGDPSVYSEIIFCGFGEPTLRLAELVEIGRGLKARGSTLRMNTNGHGNMIHGRDIVPALASFLDEISISIDAGDAATYRKIVRPDFGDAAFEGVLAFVRACIGHIPRVTLTAVDLPGLDLEPIESLARELGIGFRAREYQPMVGSTDFKKA
jgi:TatD DNase family protein